jgi:Cu+-exporting ATPase
MSIPVAKVLRPGLKEIVGKLSRKFKLSLLSGDDDSSRVEMTSIFGDNGSLYFRRSAEDKLTYVRSLQHRGEYVVMVGDGLNDAGALRQADIGVSIVEHTSAFSPSSDVILAGDSFGKLPAVFGFSRRSMSILYICFAISLAYNVVGLAYAVSGVLTPLVAAVLMPLSSASVLAVAVLGTRFQAAREGLV